MTAANPSRIGQIKGTGDTRALFLKIYSGETLTVFEANTIMKDKVRIRNITSGKSAQFVAIGTTKAGYHIPGTELLGNTIQQDEKTITIDDLLVSHTFVSRIDEAISHFEVRSEYSKQMGIALAQTYDRNLLSLAVKAARDTGAGGMGVGAVGQSNAVSQAIGATPTTADIVSAIYSAAQKLDEKNIPENDRYVIVPPSVYWALVQDDKLLDRDFGENGAYKDGKVWKVAGMSIIKSNNLALNHSHADATSVYPDYAGKYAVDASNTLALILQPQAMGTVKLLDLASEMEWDIRRQGTLLVSKLAVGHGVLRPECIYEIKKG